MPSFLQKSTKSMADSQKNVADSKVFLPSAIYFLSDTEQV